MITRLSLAVLAYAFLAVSSIHAAPPTVNYFFPAGGQRGTTVTVTADGTFGHWPPRVWVDREGVAVEPAKESGKLLVTIADDAVPATYGIRLYDGEGASSARAFLVGTLPEVMEREPNDDFKKPQVLETSSVVVNGRLGKVGDVDTFALALKKGQTLIASLEANRTLRSPLDGHLQVVSPDGFVLEHNDDFHGLDPQIVFPVPTDGTYLVRTFAFPSVPDSSIRFAGGDKFIYRLTLTTGAFFDYPYPLAVARSAPGDVDLVGWNLSTVLRTLPVPAPGEADQVTLFHPQSANVVRVRLEPHAAVVKALANSRHDPQKIDLPVTITGRIERPGDVNYYQFHGDKGQKLTFRAEAQTLGFPLDPVLQITDLEGKQLAKAQAGALGKDPVLDFTVPQDGPFLLTVRDLHGTGSGRHVYRLQADLAKPDFGLKLATDRFVIVPGKPLDVSVTIDRVHGFSNEIELDVEGVPEGVSVTTLPADSKKAKTLTLHLSADRAPYSGSVRVVGIGRGADGMTRIAQAAVAELGTATESLWLTVAK
jgi:hypothetical protein